MHVGISALANSRYLLLGVEKASNVPFASPLPTKQAGQVTPELLHSCLSLGVPCVVRYGGMEEIDATAFNSCAVG